MGDILKNNPILSHFLIPILLIFMFFSLIEKTYIETQVKHQVDIAIQDIMRTMNTLAVNDSIIIENLKKIQ